MSTHIEKIENIENAYYNLEKDVVLSSNIPRPKGFIGRENELISLRKAKAQGIRSFLFHGTGGVGKTDLALKFIEENKTVDQKACQINMLGLSKNPKLWKDAMLEVIRFLKPNVIADLATSDIKNLYNALLNEYNPILFFDNAKDRKQVELLNNVSALIIITSRTRFNVTGGFSFEVLQMSAEDARELLYSTVKSKDRFDGQIDTLAYLSGYLPMALLPLGSLLSEDVTLKARELTQRYADRKKRLALSDPNRENLSIEASFDLSYEMLNDDLKELWCILSIFPADFNLEALQSVWRIKDSNAVRSELIKKHLLEYNPQTERSRLHDIARDYTKEKILDEKRIESKLLFCLYYSKLLQDFETVTPRNLEIFDIERINIEHGFNWLAGRIKVAELFPLLIRFFTGSIIDIYLIRFHPQEFIRWNEIVLKVARKIANKDLEGNCLGNIGQGYRILGEYQRAIDCYKRSLAIAKEVGNSVSECNSLTNLGSSFWSLGEYHLAIDYHKQSLDIAIKTKNIAFKSTSLGNLGIVYRSLGETQKSIEYQEQALALAKEISDRQRECSQINNLGNAYSLLEEFEKAINYYKEALAIAEELGDRFGECSHIGNLGFAYLNLGELQTAVEYLEKSLAIATEIGDVSVKCNSLYNLGLSYEISQEYRKSIDYFHRYLTIARKSGDDSAKGNSLCRLGIAYLKLEEKEMADNYFYEGLLLLDSIESPHADYYRNLGLFETGDPS